MIRGPWLVFFFKLICRGLLSPRQFLNFLNYTFLKPNLQIYLTKKSVSAIGKNRKTNENIPFILQEFSYLHAF